MDLNYVSEQPKRLGLDTPEQMLGKGILEPFNISNSGTRKQMFSTHNSQKVPIIHAEVPYISTGNENKFGELSSCFVKNTSDYRIISKIPKFIKCPDHIYYVVYYDTATRTYDLFERSPYVYTTEVYGYLVNNQVVDRVSPGDIIPANSVISKSISYDEFDNRMDGINLLTAYLATDHTKEDSIEISESAAKKLAFPSFKKVPIQINDNDIPLNMYGDKHEYKFMPDVLEHTKSLLCSIRRQNKADALYSQSSDQLSKPSFSDQNITATGQVYDIEIYCNNPEGLASSSYDSQLLYYYNEKRRLCSEIVTVVEAIQSRMTPDENLGRTLMEMYYNCKRALAGAQYKKNGNNVFSNVVLEVMVYSEVPMGPGDKMSNRYGGKGVVSKIIPDSEMPKTRDGRTIDVIQNKNTVIGRENPGQIWEVHLNQISHAIIRTMRSGLLTDEECLDLYLRYIDKVSSTFGVYLRDEYFESKMSDIELHGFISDIISEDYIYVPVAPITDNMTIDKLAELYEEFPMANPEFDKLIVAVPSSNGGIRYVYSDRFNVAGSEYYYRLKQFGEEKVSATAMSSVNTRNENTKDNGAKQFIINIKSVPVKNGEMEIGDLLHLGCEQTLKMLMIYANSPLARRLCKSMYDGNPFNPNIRLDEESTNRQAEITQTFMKTMGLRLKIEKVPKVRVDPFVVYTQIEQNNRVIPFIEAKPVISESGNPTPFMIGYQAQPSSIQKPSPFVFYEMKKG